MLIVEAGQDDEAKKLTKSWLQHFNDTRLYVLRLCGWTEIKRS